MLTNGQLVLCEKEEYVDQKRLSNLKGACFALVRYSNLDWVKDRVDRKSTIGSFQFLRRFCKLEVQEAKLPLSRPNMLSQQVVVRNRYISISTTYKGTNLTGK
jgi:hypothetical protein